MSIAVGFMTTYVEIECTRLRFHNGRAAFTKACRQALLAAWIASYHLAPGGGFSSWTNERTPEEQLMNSRWPKDRRNMIEQITLAVSTNPQLAIQNPAPAPLYSIPQWYTNEVAAEHARLAAPLMMGPYPVTAPPAAPPGSVPVTTAPAAVPSASAPAPAPSGVVQWSNETSETLAGTYDFSGRDWEAWDEEADAEEGE